MANIIIEPIGEFKQHPKWKESYETEYRISVPFLDSDKINFSLEYFEDDENFLSDAKAIFDEFLGLTLNDREKISQYVFQNCREFLDDIEYDECDEPLHELIRNDDIHGIWQYVEPTSVDIKRNDETGEMFLLIYCNCDWEQEHGLQLTIKQGMILTAVTDITCWYEDEGLTVYLKDD